MTSHPYIALWGVMLVAACSQPDPTPRETLNMSIKPPVAKRVDHVETRHGTRVNDPYHWLRDDGRKDRDVLAVFGGSIGFSKETSVF